MNSASNFAARSRVDMKLAPNVSATKMEREKGFHQFLHWTGEGFEFDRKMMSRKMT